MVKMTIRGLNGKCIALTGTRKIDELRKIVENLGGNAVHRPTQGIVTVHPNLVDAAVAKFLEVGADWVVFTTGMGLDILIESAVRLGEKEAFLARLLNTKIAARGYKTAKALQLLGVATHARDDDGTTAGLIRALEPFDFQAAHVAVQLHGNPAPSLLHWFQARGATVMEILPYEHTPPAAEAVELLVSEVLSGQVDAVTFTSALQVHGLIDWLRVHGQTSTVLNAFEQHVMAVAVGKVTAEALYDTGVHRVLVPEDERMGSMMVHLAKFYLAQ